jgi:hypothetical protein
VKKQRVAATQIELPALDVQRATGPEIMRSKFGPALGAAVCGTCVNYYQHYGTGDETWHTCAQHDGAHVFRQDDRGCALHQVRPEYKEVKRATPTQ